MRRRQWEERWAERTTTKADHRADSGCDVGLTHTTALTSTTRVCEYLPAASRARSGSCFLRPRGSRMIARRLRRIRGDRSMGCGCNGMPSIAGRRGRRSDRLCQTVIFLGFAAVNRAAIDRILARNRSIRRVAEPGVITDHAPSRPGPRAFVEGLIQMPRSSPTRCGRSGARSSSTTWCGGSMPGPIDRRGEGDVARGSPGPPRGAVGHKSGREIWRESEPARLTFAIGYHLFPDRHRTSQI